MLFAEHSAQIAENVEFIGYAVKHTFLDPEALKALPYLIGFSFIMPTIAVVGMHFYTKDMPNWAEVARDDRYVYEQHKTKRKRRVRPVHPVKTLDEKKVKAWLKYRTESLL